MRIYTIEELEDMDVDEARKLIQTMTKDELRDLESQYNDNLGKLSEDDIHVWGIVRAKLQSLLVAEAEEKFFKAAPNTPEYDANEVDAEVKRLASAITGWDTKDVRNLKLAIEELKKYGESAEYYHTVGEHDIMRYAGIDITDLPVDKNIKKILLNVDTFSIWAVDLTGMCLYGYDYDIISLAEALKINDGYEDDLYELGDAARLNTKQAGIELAILRGRNIPYSVKQINAYIKSKRLPARKSGRDWLIRVDDLDKIIDLHSGRPKKID